MEATSKRDERLLMDRSVPGRMGVSLPGLDVPPQPLPEGQPLREDLALPELSEGEVVRYFSRLSQLNFSTDTHFYPLGSCTMKYNPKINEELAAQPGFAHLHPRQQGESAQGALRLMFDFQGLLSEITGMSAISLAPLAGAHGELSGMLMIRAYHREQGDRARTKVIIPDSAHGTNPASATMAGFGVVSVATGPDGNMDIEALKQEATSDLAGMMFTLPNTLGLFDTGIIEVCRIVHEAGGLVYCDGANMNALLGRVKLGDLGFDVAHLNLHKTFSTPHGGGGPGSGPVCANPGLAPFLPAPIVTRTEDDTFALATPAKSVGRVGGFHGNFGVLVKAYAYVRTLAAIGLKEVSGNAVLNANYLLNRLKDLYHLPYDRRCMHEAIFSAQNQQDRGVRALDIAKRLLDYGFHAPTMYFPLIVKEALLIEPVETESKENIDAFIEAMREIDKESREEPGLVKGAPYTTSISRLDEAGAARHPDLRWQP